MNSPSIKDKHPDRKNLGPTGPADAPLEGEQRYDRKHPNAGTVDSGPTPTDDRRSEADKLENKIDKKRADAAPD